ncbi:MAG: hypothetical protein ACRBCT_09935 [Alphaproteobacteria bacterium]
MLPFEKNFKNIAMALRGGNQDIIARNVLASFFQMNKRASFYGGRHTSINDFYPCLKKAFIRAQNTQSQGISYYLGSGRRKVLKTLTATREVDLRAAYSQRALNAGNQTKVEITDGPFVFDTNLFEKILEQRFSHIDSRGGKSPKKTLTKKAAKGIGLALLNEAWLCGMDITIIDSEDEAVQHALQAMKDKGAVVKFICVANGQDSVANLQEHLRFNDSVEFRQKSSRMIGNRTNNVWDISDCKTLTKVAHASGLSGQSAITTVAYDPDMLAFPSLHR